MTIFVVLLFENIKLVSYFVLKKDYFSEIASLSFDKLLELKEI